MKKLEDINHPNIDLDKILGQIENKFVLSIGVSKRAKQLKDGIKPLVEIDPDRPFNEILIALKEIETGKINIELTEKHESHVDKLEEMDHFLEEELKKEKVKPHK